MKLSIFISHRMLTWLQKCGYAFSVLIDLRAIGCYCAVVLIGRIKDLARPFVCLSVTWTLDSVSKSVKNEKWSAHSKGQK